LEQQLLQQFMPTFMVDDHDCSVRPSEFEPGNLSPQVAADNGTIYGQAFPAKSNTGGTAVELHYYHLWKKDCGRHGHPLDTEHVAALVQPKNTAGPDQWQALYWYAAAHEKTVCDVSQIARASTLHAEDHGATVWISPGKHASYLDRVICQKGCGADHCEAAAAQLDPPGLINLGEPGSPMNGATFTASKAWLLESKMANSDFPSAAIVSVNNLPKNEIALFNPGRHPVQGIIATSSSTEQAIAASGCNTAAALSTASNSTGAALSTSTQKTDNALQKTGHALGAAAKSVARALHLVPESKDPQHQ
jgi:hypothetical protein